ncbi:MAG: hypothetical protein AVDCRST_MAG68-2758, partial [uncultured Gemmatimonadetes bacterium]
GVDPLPVSALPPESDPPQPRDLAAGPERVRRSSLGHRGDAQHPPACGGRRPGAAPVLGDEGRTHGARGRHGVVGPQALSRATPARQPGRVAGLVLDRLPARRPGAGRGCPGPRRGVL